MINITHFDGIKNSEEKVTDSWVRYGSLKYTYFFRYDKNRQLVADVHPQDPAVDCSLPDSKWEWKVINYYDVSFNEFPYGIFDKGIKDSYKDAILEAEKSLERMEELLSSHPLWREEIKLIDPTQPKDFL